MENSLEDRTSTQPQDATAEMAKSLENSILTLPQGPADANNSLGERNQSPPQKPVDTDETLYDHIQSLPQELQDMILDLALILPTKPITLDSTYRPPLALQLTRKTRAASLNPYYASTSFAIPFQKTKTSKSAATTLAKFYLSVSASNWSLIPKITLPYYRYDPWWDGYFETPMYGVMKAVDRLTGCTNDEAVEWKTWECVTIHVVDGEGVVLKTYKKSHWD